MQNGAQALLLCAVLLGAVLSSAAWAQLSVPATFVREVRQPGFGDEILRPSAMHFDDLHGEILVGDPGHDRVVIFSETGAYKFAFALGDSMTTPVDLVTDPTGTIFVLGSSSRGRVLQRFDFDGLPMVQIEVPTVLDDVDVALKSLACDDRGNLYGFDSRGLRVLKLFPGQSSVVCNLKLQLADNTAGAYGFGTLAWDHGEFLLPVATMGFVLRYTTAGEYLGSVGHAGAKPGALAFPVAVERSSDGIFLVLDKNRFCVVCYGPDGLFLGEFGGKGLSPGWFVNPSLLAVLGSDSVAVGQIYANRIQIVGLPRFIHDKVVGSAVTPSTSESVDQVGQAALPTDFLNSRRFITTTFCLFTCGSIVGRHNLYPVSPSEASS